MYSITTSLQLTVPRFRKIAPIGVFVGAAATGVGGLMICPATKFHQTSQLTHRHDGGNTTVFPLIDAVGIIPRRLPARLLPKSGQRVDKGCAKAPQFLVAVEVAYLWSIMA